MKISSLSARGYRNRLATHADDKHRVCHYSLKPAVYIAFASICCFLFTALLPPVIDPAALAELPLLGGLSAELAVYWFRFFLSFVLLGLVPLALAFLFRERPSDLGLVFTTPILRSPFFWALLPAFFLLGALASLSPDLAAYYPYSRDLIARVAERGFSSLFGHYAAYFFLYYLPWEFFFRGFLLLALAKAARRGLAAEFAAGTSLGPQGAGTASSGGSPRLADNGALFAALVLFQTLPSTMLHVGHPVSELFGAVLAGLGFGVLAWKSGSILPGLLLHAAIGLGTDTFIVLRGAGLLR